MADTKRLLGIAIGGTKCAVTVGHITNDTVTVIKKISVKTFPEDAGKTLSAICNAADQLDFEFDCIGIICGGPLDTKRGIINTPPNLPGFNGVKVVEIFESRYGKPAVLINDADACALAEWRFGAGRGTENMIFLTCGTGFGAGLILGGRLYSGTLGMAGEIGHVRLSEFGGPGYGKVGAAEGFVSGSGIGKTATSLALSYLQRGEKTALAQSIDDAYRITAEAVGKAAREGDACATEVMDITAEKLGDVLAILADILNPECFVLGGVYARCEDLLKSGAVKRFYEEALPTNAQSCRILPSQLREQIDEYSSLAAAEYAISKERSKQIWN